MTEPSFDTWTAIFLLFAFQSVVLGIVFFAMRRGDRKANAALGLLMFLFTVTLLDCELYWTGYGVRFPHFVMMSAPAGFLFGPLLLYYMRRIVRRDALRARDVLHLIPFVLSIGVMLPWYTAPADVKRVWLTEGMQWAPWQVVARGAMPWLKILHMMVYTWAAYRCSVNGGLLREMRRWSNGLLLCAAGYILGCLAYYVLVKFPFFSPEWDYSICTSLAVFISFVAVGGYVQPAVFEGYSLSEVKHLVKEPERYAHSSLTPGAAKELYARLEAAMHAEHLHRSNDIRLESLALKLGTTRHNLSQVINERAGTNFFGYINHFRVEEAKTLLRAHDARDLQVSEVAYQVGFNTRTAFYSTFKRYTGTTPTAFRQASKV